MESSAKKAKLSNVPSRSASSNVQHAHVDLDIEDFMKKLQAQREKTAESILQFRFNTNRRRFISQCDRIPDRCAGVVYWMSRDNRVQDNWAFLFAQKLALEKEVPLHICLCLARNFDSSVRRLDFLIKGLEKVAAECRELNISFHLLDGNGAEVLPQWVERHNIGAVVCDFSPLRGPRRILDECKHNLQNDVPLIQVDAHNVVPCWRASPKKEYSAKTFRDKITPKLNEYLTEFPPVIRHPYTGLIWRQPIDWNRAIESREADRSVGPVAWARSGYDEALRILKRFIDTKLVIFDDERKNPTIDARSGLAPWFNFGQISAQRAALCMEEYKQIHTKSVETFLEHTIVRRELADNFCFYCGHYDRIEGTSQWARVTLNDHRNDERPHIYTREQFANADTHDTLYNTAQRRLINEGRMHGWIRMYWAKKILEWTPSPEDALEYAIYLNDHFSLDGCDPISYVGCMWSVCGLHDTAWGERPIFGKVRFMNASSLRNRRERRRPTLLPRRQ